MFRSGGKALRLSLFAVFLFATFVWLIAGHPFAKRIADSRSRSAQSSLDRITDQLMKEDPEAAAMIAKLQEDRRVRELPLASAVRDAEARGGLSAVRAMLHQPTVDNALPDEVRLAMLATDPTRLGGQEDRERFLYAHGTALDVLQQAGNHQYTAAYLNKMEDASRDEDRWRAVYDDSFSLVVLDLVDDERSRRYYEQEKNEVWMEESLISIASMADNDEDPQAQPEIVTSFLRVAEQFHPYFKEAIVEHDFDASVFFLFDQHGKLIRRSIGEHGLPLDEVLEVVFANSDFLAERENTEAAAQLLALIRNEKPSVWQAARRSALALRLEHDVPRHAEAILRQYGSDDIAVLLYAGYESELVFAAEALAKFGDLAVYILGHYEEVPSFHEALRHPGIGPQLIPYVARFGDPGLDRLADNQAWLDKYFQADGTPREKEWWTQIPGGAAFDVARNWSNGHPNEWSELGWAALDVADAALLVASLGATSAVTTSVKQGTKTAARKAARDQVKRQVVRSGRNRAATLSQRGARAAAKKESQSLLRRVAARGMHFGRAVRVSGGRTWRLAVSAGRIITTPAGKVFSAAKTLNQTWRGVPAVTRRIVYRSLLAVGLFVTITQRTLPALPEIGEAAGGFVRDVVEDANTAMSEGLVRAIEAFLDREVGDWQGVFSWIVYVLVLAVLGGLTWLTRPVFRRFRHA